MVFKLLCATDGSKSAQQAITFSVNLAKKENASLTFLNVNGVSPERASRTHFWDQEILDAAAIQVHKGLSAAMDSAAKAGLKNADSTSRRVETRQSETRAPRKERAGSGNRTRMASLEDWNFTIKLYPRSAANVMRLPKRLKRDLPKSRKFAFCSEEELSPEDRFWLRVRDPPRAH